MLKPWMYIVLAFMYIPLILAMVESPKDLVLGWEHVFLGFVSGAGFASCLFMAHEARMEKV